MKGPFSLKRLKKKTVQAQHQHAGTLHHRAITIPDIRWHTSYGCVSIRCGGGIRSQLPCQKVIPSKISTRDSFCQQIDEEKGINDRRHLINNEHQQPAFSEPFTSGKLNFREQSELLSHQLTWFRRVVAECASYFSFHLSYIVSLSFLGSFFIYFFESGRIRYIDALFVSISACSLTGLASVDISRLSLGSHWVILFCIALCSNVLLSTVPLLIRLYFYRQSAQRALETVEYDVLKNVNVNALLKREVVEYQALAYLLKCILTYFFVVPAFSVFLLVFYLTRPGQGAYAIIEKAAREKTMSSSNLWFFSLFHSVSAFGNSGFALHESNMMAFAQDYGILFPLSLVILLGNSYYPIAVYCLIWVLNQYQHYHKEKMDHSHICDAKPPICSTRSYSGAAKTQFLLDNPRRCFTHMFPGPQTFILLCVASALLFCQMVTFIWLDFNKSYLRHLSIPNRLLSIWFQITCTRTAGFSSIDIFQTSEAIKLLWVCFMYIVSYPFIIAVRSSTIEVSQPCGHSRLFQEIFSRVSTFRLKKLYKSFFLFLKYNPLSRKTLLLMRFHNHHTSPLAFVPAKSPFVSEKPQSSFSTDFGCRSHTTEKPSSVAVSPSVSFAQFPNQSISLNPTEKECAACLMPLVNCFEADCPAFAPQCVAYLIYIVLLQDLFWLFLFCVLICIIEDKQFAKISRLNVFSIIFETASAYGTVGLSLGYDSSSVSLSGILSPFSKCVIMLVMIMGRHRCLPLAIDRAVNLPTLLNIPRFCRTHENFTKSKYSYVRRWTSQPCSLDHKDIQLV